MGSVMGKVVGLAVLAFALLGGGCGSTMGRYDLRVGMDSVLANQPGGAPSITVNVVAVPPAEQKVWDAKDMGEYWSPRDGLREGAQSYARVMQFGPGRAGPQTLSKDDPIWNVWKQSGATQLYVLADLPGSHQSRPGAEDARRLILPLDTRHWDGTMIEVELQRENIRPKTPMKVVDKK